MKKKFFAYMIIGILLFTFLAQGKGTKTYWFQIASQGEGESGFLTNSNLNQKKVYLTFDDGPSDHTAQILDILKKHKVKATFFVVGKETEHAKKMYQRIVLEGHTLAMHSYSHNYDQIYASVDAFSKDLMKKYDIPTAAYENFDNADEALAYLETAKFPIVLKADGLALGKGVLICKDLEEAKAGVKEIMLDKHFGNAGNTMVIEEFMTGREVSVLAFCDGTTIKPMTSAQDHKRAQDGDQGLNTGGMGTFSPSPFYTDEIADYCMENIYKPTMAAMKAEKREFKGVLFCGLMITPQGVKVLEYNARFGDPEAQVVLPRMKNDIIDVFEACIDGTLDQVELEFEDNAAVCVVLASDGYPVSYKKGYPISGLETFKDKDGYYVFHAGTKFEDGKVVTNGGRVLGVTATGKDLHEARANAYKATEWITFENKYMRHDIGKAIDEC